MSLTALASEIETHIKQALKFKVDAYGVRGRCLFKTVLVLTKVESSSCLSEAEPENDMMRMIHMYQVGARVFNDRSGFHLKLSSISSNLISHFGWGESRPVGKKGSAR